MARLRGFEIADPNANTRAMESILASTAQDLYENCKIGWEVNDGKYLNFIDDRDDL